MTVSSSVNRIQFAGDATTLTFSTTPVKFFTSADIDVIEVSAAGVATTLALTTDYTVTGGAGTSSAAAIGTIATTGLHGTIAVGKTLVIVRRLDVVQSADFVNNDASDAEVVEAAFDKAIMIAQQNTADIARSLVVADGFTGTFDFTVPSDALVAGGSIVVNTGATGFAAGPTASAISTAQTNATASSVQATAAAVQSAAASVSATAAAASAASAVAAVGTVKVTTGDATSSVLSAKIVGDIANGLTVNFTAATGSVATIASTAAWITGRTEDTAPDSNADYVNTYDASATAIKKTLVGRIGQIAYGATVATTSGVTVSVTTAIPSWVKRVTVLLDGVSLSGTSDVLVQIGSTSFSTSGYVAASALVNSGGATAVRSSTAGYPVAIGTAAHAVNVRMVLESTGGNQWFASHAGAKTVADTSGITGSGTLTLGGTLDRLRLISANGTDTFDLGQVVVHWE